MKLNPFHSRLADRLAPFLALAVLGGILSVTTQNFLGAGNLLNIALQTAVIAIIAIGETFVIISAGIDLSVGSVLALSGVTASLAMAHGLPLPTATALKSLVQFKLAGWYLWHVPVPVAVLVGTGTGALCGFINGAVTTRFQMPSFIVTLGMMGICRGAAMILTGNAAIYGLPHSFDWLGKGRVAGVPVPALLMVLLAVAASILLKYTRFGRHAYAIGGNAEASRLSGVPTARTVVLVFVLCGALCGFAGTVHASRIGMGSSTEGKMYELDAIAAVVIGGASLFGGEGTIMGTVVGAFLMSVLRNGCNLLGLQVEWQQVAIGVIIILAVIYDHLRRRNARTVR